MQPVKLSVSVYPCNVQTMVKGPKLLLPWLLKVVLSNQALSTDNELGFV